MTETERQYWIARAEGRDAFVADVLSLNPHLDPLIDLVLAHAHVAENYSTGWDIVAETMDRHDVLRYIVSARTLDEALATFSALVDVHHDRTLDARNSAF
jgi:hypothetical protein